jgi:type II secretory pathway component PulM
MRPNRQNQERLQAVERKAVAEAREIISKAERAAGRNARRRKALIRDAVIALVVAIIIAALWKPLILLLTAVAVP